MILLTTGLYSKKQISEIDFGTNGKLPTTKEYIIVCNPLGYGIPSYKISKIKVSNSYQYKIEVLLNENSL